MYTTASGKPEEKEMRLKKEKDERRKEKEKEVLERRINRVYSKMWTYNQTYQYSVVTPEGTTGVESVWCKCKKAIDSHRHWLYINLKTPCRHDR